MAPLHWPRARAARRPLALLVARHPARGCIDDCESGGRERRVGHVGRRHRRLLPLARRAWQRHRVGRSADAAAFTGRTRQARVPRHHRASSDPAGPVPVRARPRGGASRLVLRDRRARPGAGRRRVAAHRGSGARAGIDRSPPAGRSARPSLGGTGPRPARRGLRRRSRRDRSSPTTPARPCPVGAGRRAGAWICLRSPLPLDPRRDRGRASARCRGPARVQAARARALDLRRLARPRARPVATARRRCDRRRVRRSRRRAGARRSPRRSGTARPSSPARRRRRAGHGARRAGA